MKKNKKIILIHRSVGWDKDSRIRKMKNSFEEKSFDLAVCLWERANIKKKIYLSSSSVIFCKRIFFASKNHTGGGPFILLIELFQEFIQGIFFIFYHQPDIIIIQNHRQFLHLFSAYLYKSMSKNKVKIVWDLREIPNGFKDYNITKNFFSFLCKIPSYIWVMNSGRLDYMNEKFSINKEKTYIVPNFCEMDYWKAAKAPLDHSIKSFLVGSDYVYIQNPFSKERYGYNSISSILSGTDKKIICTGNISDDLINGLVNSFGKKLIDEKILFTGSIKEEKLQSLIDNSAYSIILYDSSIINNKYCDANRLYQCISRHIPVIVGNNPGLAEYVATYKLGEVLKDDGRDLESLKKAVIKFDQMISKNQEFGFINARRFMTWELNQKVINLLN